jgi:hypothetical protein
MASSQRIISLAVKVTGDTAGLNLTKAERSLQALQAETEKVGEVFKKFEGSSAAAANAAQQFGLQSTLLNKALEDGRISAPEYAKEFANIAKSVEAEAKALERAAQITEANLTAFDKFANSQSELRSQLEAGRITQETYNRAIEAAARGLTDAERAAAGLAERNRDAEIAAAAAAEAESRRLASVREAASVTASVQSAEERREARLTRLRQLFDDGFISQEAFNRAVEQASGAQEEAARAEQARQRVLAEGERVTQQFATIEERRAKELERLDGLLRDGAISEETFRRASLEASGANEEAARAERERASALAEAGRIIQANLTPQEKYQETIQSLRSQLEAGRISQETFNRAAAKAEGDLRKAAGGAKEADTALKNIEKTLRVIGVITVGRALIDGFRGLAGTLRTIESRISGIVRNVTQSLDRIDKLSIRTGVGRQALQGFGLAAELAGVSTEQLGTALQRLAGSIGQAQPPSSLTNGLKQLNLTVTELRRLSPEDQFSLIAKRISEIPDPARRAAIAVELFGRQGRQLASLFGEAGQSLEEVRQRAERLGIIVSDTQVSNVTKLNDTFKIVRSTIEGIIGQVSGNLAPVVTEIAEQFLKFVETFDQFSVGGGTGVADLITDKLLEGAEFLGRVFDDAVEQFRGFSVTLDDVSKAFAFTTNVLKTVVNAISGAISLLQAAGNLLTLGFARILEQIGRLPFLSDVKQYGKDLADAAAQQFNNNADKFVESVDRAIDSAGSAIFGETPQEAAERGAGAAESYISEFRQKIERERAPEFRVATNIEETQKKLTDFLKDAGDGANEFLVSSQETLATFKGILESGQANASTLKVMTGFVDKLNGQLREDARLRQEALDLARKQSEEDDKRVEALLKVTDAASKASLDLASVERKIAAVQAEIAETGVGEDGAAQKRLEQLQKLQRQLENDLEAAALGFEQGFDKAFKSTNDKIRQLTDRAEDFGKATFNASRNLRAGVEFDEVATKFSLLSRSADEFGRRAAEAGERLKKGIEEAQQKVKDGLLTRETYDREVARREELYQKELQNIRDQAAERKRVNELVDNQILLSRFGGDQSRLTAAQNLAAIEREIARVQVEQTKARNAGDKDLAAAAAARIAQLDQVAAKERDIASGRKKLEEEIAKQREEALKAFEQQQQEIQQQQQKIREEQNKAIAAEFDRQTKRIRDLNTLGAGVISGTDIRTDAGAGLFQQLVANAQDPTLIEARLQSRRLGELVNLVQSLTNLPIRTIGALGVG